jgi:hypothetical protein
MLTNFNIEFYLKKSRHKSIFNQRIHLDFFPNTLILKKIYLNYLKLFFLPIIHTKYHSNYIFLFSFGNTRIHLSL